VFSAHNLICENGSTLAEAHKFADESVYADIDVERICSERRRMSTYAVVKNSAYTEVKAHGLIDKDLELIHKCKVIIQLLTLKQLLKNLNL
jgi:NAD+ synthase (glutamine-hydrolysing)